MLRTTYLALGLASMCWASTVAAAANGERPMALDSAAAARFAGLALKCLHAEYPNHISHTMDGDADVRPPHALNPAFYGCFDWHSDVHGHWLLARLVRLYPGAPFAVMARAELARSLTAENIAGEVAYLERAHRASFERPYGLAWLLLLSAELRGWDDPQAREWASVLRPLETEAAVRLKNWVPRLYYPIRVGAHDQTAFSFGLMWDWAGAAGDMQMRGMLASIASRLDFATTAARALELTDTHRYSVIFLDGTLPDEDTYELCAQIKKHPLQREAVVVMLTGGYSPAERVMGLLAGFDNYLVKPIQPAMFNELAAEIVRPATAI